MLSFDFQTFMKDEVSITNNQDYLLKKESIFRKLKESPMTGWREVLQDETLIEKIIAKASWVRRNSSCLVVIGIGGSYMGCYALDKLFSSQFFPNSFPLIYAGYQISDAYLEELISYLKEKDFCLNVISKSGTTLETTIAYQKLLDFMKKKYSEEELRQRIIITTDKNKGVLREDVINNRYFSFEIPDNIGGRYSVLSVVGLFPLATQIDIRKLLSGAMNASAYMEDAYFYAYLRKELYNHGRVVENFVVYDEKMLMFCEWLKQLFAESEGKENRGILPISTFNTRDLHSLGQFFQEGNPIIFETVLRMQHFGNKERVQDIAIESVCEAHMSHTPSNVITCSDLSEYTVGELIYFFFLSAAFSALLFEVDPFNQPGVEAYKEKMRERL